MITSRLHSHVVEWDGSHVVAHDHDHMLYIKDITAQRKARYPWNGQSKRWPDHQELGAFGEVTVGSCAAAHVVTNWRAKAVQDPGSSDDLTIYLDGQGTSYDVKTAPFGKSVAFLNQYAFENHPCDYYIVVRLEELFVGRVYGAYTPAMIRDGLASGVIKIDDSQGEYRKSLKLPLSRRLTIDPPFWNGTLHEMAVRSIGPDGAAE